MTRFEFEYMNQYTNGAWIRTRFDYPIPTSRVEAEKSVEQIARNWVEGTRLRWVLITTMEEFGIAIAAQPERTHACT